MWGSTAIRPCTHTVSTVHIRAVTSRLLHSLEDIFLRTVLFIILLSCLRSNIVILDTLIVFIYLLTYLHRRSHSADRVTWSAPAPIRRRHTDIRDLPSLGDSGPHGSNERVYQRCRRLNDVRTVYSSRSENRSTLVRFFSSAAPYPECPLRVCADIKPRKYTLLGYT